MSNEKQGSVKVKLIKDHDPSGRCSIHPRLAKCTPENFKKFFEEHCKKDTRKWDKAYRDIGGVIEKPIEKPKTNK